MRAVSETEMMEGRIITASTTMEASRLSPAAVLKVSRMKGTSTIRPTRPYTMEGMPARRSTTGRMTAATRRGATLERNTAMRKPMGTPMTMAPAVP